MSSFQSKVRCRVGIVSALGLALGVWMAAGCGGSGSATSGSDSTTSSASLTTVPTTDVSSYDPTTSTSSPSSSESPVASVGKSLSKSVAKGEFNKPGDDSEIPGVSDDGIRAGEGFRGEDHTLDNKYDTSRDGGSSRAGCEQNMQKKEIVRNAAQAQLDRCYIQAFESAGLISIPTDGSRAVYFFKPPAENDEDRSKKCAGIPVERERERTACLQGNEGPTGGAVAARVGFIDNALQIDVCSGTSESNLKLENESTYTGGDSPTFSAIRIGTWQGAAEKNSITGSLTGVSSIKNGAVTLSDTGAATITALMDGGFGSGRMTFAANKLNYTLIGGFSGSFTDPFSDSTTSFTGKVAAKVGKELASDATNKGTSQFSFTGRPPAMPLKNMIPFDMAGAQLENFLKTFGAEMNMVLTLSNYESVYVCPNPDFDFSRPDLSKKPMLQVSKGESCGSQTHTGIESFEVTNIVESGNYGNKVEQTFKTIPDSQSPFYALISRVDLSKVSASAGAIAFVRNWDCSGITAARTIDLSNPESVSAGVLAKLPALTTAMEECSQEEEKLRDNEGMGGHDCGGQEMSVIADNIKDDPPSFGNAGGDYTRSSSNCADGVAPERMFINAGIQANEYCIPVGVGGCEVIHVESSELTNQNIQIRQGTIITNIAFTGGAGAGFTSKATGANFTFNGDCFGAYTLSQPSFDKPPTPVAGELPEKCRSNSITDPEACRQYCGKPENHCF
ncbi:MAG: hypothetical protein COV45_05815 [Deltaproteobacteria bacterium CG11_big_fil_rev_8_21_14_0_20_47_16]|nr:MAG: hypothetical protein COV45_05815 [Deltaproteobacteria bacterium CG11_big_fil_rev_8_21_14_0_20_47_16]